MESRIDSTLQSFFFSRIVIYKIIERKKTMDATSIDRFIDFCDISQIANEGFGETMKKAGKAVWESIKRVFEKIKLWFRNILRSINVFKTAKLDEQMNKDLIHILQSSQPKMELSYNALRIYFTLSKKKLKTDADADVYKIGSGEAYSPFAFFNPEVQSLYTSMKGWIDKCLIDIDNCLKIIKESDQRKRIDEDNYKNQTIIEIPLANINSDLKKSDSILTQYNTSLYKIESTCEKMEGKAGEIAANMMRRLYNKIIEYYTSRISLLNKYFSKAKASFGAIKKNIAEKRKENNLTRSNFKPTVKEKRIAHNKEILDLYENAKNARTYKEYKPYYDELIKKCKIPVSVIEAISEDNTTGIKTIKVQYGEENKHSMEIDKSMKLYHSSYSDNLTQLEPQWKAGGGAMFSTPRVYFHMGVPLDRYSMRNDSTPYYEPAINITKVWSDKELGSTACYVETDKPIPVKPFDYSQFRKMRDVELSLDKQK